MNIVFIDNDADPPYFGGTTTMTRIQADILETEGHHCILGYLREFEHPSEMFKEKVKISQDNIDEIRHLCAEKKIDYVINQMQHFDYNLLQPFKDVGATLIHAFYAQPQMWGTKKKELVKNAQKARNPKLWLKTFGNLLFYSIYLKRVRKYFEIFFQEDYNYCDLYMLLSKRYFSCLQEFVPYADKSKMFYLGNPITYNEILNNDLLKNKQKEVLTICRFSYEKRLEETLKIWKEIELDIELGEWVLNLIGDGPDWKKLHSLANKLGLRKVRFLGQIKAPVSYYKSASVFMMTSELEGWPMVLNECQQFGDVPIAYDSFAALYDIIEDGENGVIVKEGERESYVKKLKVLLKSDNKRIGMMNKALEYSGRHTKEKYAEDFLAMVKCK